MAELERLRSEWKNLYSQTLPQLARARDAAQPKWPVALDHCFARIILDNVIGQGVNQWDQILAKPAVRHMDEAQLRDAIALGRQIQAGEADLCVLDEISLQTRAKSSQKYHAPRAQDDSRDLLNSTTSKRKWEATEGDGQRGPATKKATSKKSQSTLPFGKEQKASGGVLDTVSSAKPDLAPPDHIKATLQRVQTHPSLTPYRTKLYTTLLSVPRGRYTTYAAMSDYLHSSARAVGNGMRNNPFAPDVPCHRVLAANGTIGGFYGDWGKDGKYAKQKIQLLRDEGVKFDGKGRVIGEPFRDFHTFEAGD